MVASFDQAVAGTPKRRGRPPRKAPIDIGFRRAGTGQDAEAPEGTDLDALIAEAEASIDDEMVITDPDADADEIPESVQYFAGGGHDQEPAPERAADWWPIPDDSAFLDANNKAVTHIPAPDPAQIGLTLLRECAEFEELTTKRITYLWRRKGGSSGGAPVMARTLAPRGLLGELLEADFVIVLSADHLRGTGYTQVQGEALIYHHLKRCGITTDGNPRVMAPDFHAFTSEVERYGAWRQPLRTAESAFVARQARLEL